MKKTDKTPKVRKNGKKPAIKSQKTLESLKKYASDVLGNELTACKHVKQACQRFLNDIDRQKEKGIYWDEASAERILKFFEFCPHVKGEWTGEHIKLESWQLFIIGNVFGWKRVSDDTRRFRQVYLEVGRKNSKSTMMAVMGLYSLIADKELGAEVYSAATTRDQAKIVFEIAQNMVRRSELKEQVEVLNFNLNNPALSSKMQALASDSNTLDGLNISCALLDEIHAWKTRDLYDVVITATGARRQPLIIMITTAGFDKNSFCYTMHDYTKKINTGIFEDDSFFGIIYSLDEEDDWKDEKLWIKANPNLNVSVKIDDLRSKAKMARELPSLQNAFLQKHMNIWTSSSEAWLPDEKLDACTRKIYEEDLKGLPCYAGLDLSSRIDVTALGYIFPPKYTGDKFKALCRFWIPADNIEERVRRDKVPFDVWVKQGYVIATDGNVIDYDFILYQIEQDVRLFDIQSLCFDPSGATRFIQDLQKTGFEDPKENKYTERPLITFNQNYTNYTVPIREFEKLVIGNEIILDANPCLRWMASNVVLRVGTTGVMPDKGKSTERIDGIVALLMALSRAVLFTDDLVGPAVTLL